MYLKIIFLSLLQAFTEFLPVSSSGHLLFFQTIFNLNQLPLIFDITVHLGSLIAVLIFYFKNLLDTLKYSYLELKEKQQEKPQTKFIIYITISTIITFLMYISFQPIFDKLFTSAKYLYITFFITTIILFSTYFFTDKKTTSISKKNILYPFIVGIFQGFAIAPGISRSGSTIAASLILKVDRKEAAYYSFTLFIPAVLGALVLDLFKNSALDFLKQNLLLVIIAFTISAFFSYLFLKLLVYIIKKGKFWIFAIYTLLMSIISFITFTL